MSSRASRFLLWVMALLLVPGLGVSFARAEPAQSHAGEEGLRFDSIRKPAIPVSFLTHETNWVTFLYPPSARDRMSALFAKADDQRAELAEVLGRPPLTGIEVRVARGVEEMAILSPQELPPSVDAIGASYPSIRLIVLSSTAGSGNGRSDLLQAFQQQLARIALHEATGGQSLPEWFGAGLAVHLSDERRWAHDWLLFRAGVRRAWVPLFDPSGQPADSSRRNLRDLELAAVEGEDFVDSLLRGTNRSRFPTTVESLRQGKELSTALRDGYGVDATALELNWRRQLARRMTVTFVAMILSVPAAAFVLLFGARYLRARKMSKKGVELLVSHRRSRSQTSTSIKRGRVHIIINPRDESATAVAAGIQSDVPKIEHDGEWHTLH